MVFQLLFSISCKIEVLNKKGGNKKIEFHPSKIAIRHSSVLNIDLEGSSFKRFFHPLFLPIHTFN